MANLLTDAEVASYLGLSASDPIIDTIVPLAEAIAAEDCGFDSLSAPDPDADGDDTFDYAGTGPYYLRRPNPHGTLTVDGAAAPTYRIDGRRLVFATLPTLTDSTWSKLRFSYRYGWTSSTVPPKMKAALLSLVSFLNSKRASEGVKEFSQGELRIVYDSAAMKGELPDLYKYGISNYKKVNLFSDDTATRFMP